MSRRLKKAQEDSNDFIGVWMTYALAFFSPLDGGGVEEGHDWQGLFTA